MKVSELLEYIGQVGHVHYGDMRVDVRVLDIAYKYGRPTYHIEPVSGVGSMWVEHVTFTGGV